MKENEIYGIYGLEKVSWFPPGLGWLYTAIAIAFLLWLVARLNRWNNYRKEAWQYQAKIELKKIETLHQISLIELHDFIKKLAVHKFAREDVAKLSGDTLLIFLNENDPSNFKWSSEATFLNAIYKKQKEPIKTSKIKDITRALKKWI